MVICSQSTYSSAELLSKLRSADFRMFTFFHFNAKGTWKIAMISHKRYSMFTYSVKVSAKSVQYFPR